MRPLPRPSTNLKWWTTAEHLHFVCINSVGSIGRHTLVLMNFTGPRARENRNTHISFKRSHELNTSAPTDIRCSINYIIVRNCYTNMHYGHKLRRRTHTTHNNKLQLILYMERRIPVCGLAGAGELNVPGGQMDARDSLRMRALRVRKSGWSRVSFEFRI